MSMNGTLNRSLLLLAIGGMTLLPAVDNLQRARFTEVIRDVVVTKPDNTASRTAQVDGVFSVPEVIRTGIDSRAEIEAPDKTIARIGANTIFSFEAAERTMNLQSGSVLFHSPKGKGGGTIKTASATAAVTGTTMIVGATSNGGFKVMLLEGSGRVTHPSGDSRKLNAGQLTFVIPGQNKLGPVIDFDLQRATQNSNLIQGFDKEISSQEKIDSEVNKQQSQIRKGEKAETNQDIAGDKPSRPPRAPENRPPFPILNEFPKLKLYLDANSGSNLTINSSDISSLNLFKSNNFISGIFEGSNFQSIGNMAALAAKDLAFSSITYDFSNLGKLDNFFFVASGGGNIQFNNSSNFTFTGDVNRYNFISTKGTLHFAGTNPLKFSSETKQLHFEANGNITTGTDLKFEKDGGGNFNKVSMTSKSGNITLGNPTFNSQVVELRGSRVDLTNFNITQFTGPKTMNVYTDTGNWYVGSALPSNAGSLNIQDTAASTSTSGVAGEFVYRNSPGRVDSNIRSLKNN